MTSGSAALALKMCKHNDAKYVDLVSPQQWRLMGFVVQNMQVQESGVMVCACRWDPSGMMVPVCMWEGVMVCACMCM